jgi:hypothetical protein
METAPAHSLVESGSTPGHRSEPSIVVLDRFIQATRDSGYKGTASAVSELIDNSIQAGANHIAISLVPAEEDGSICVHTLDNGCGMDAHTLRESLRFGGSTRFGVRTGLGRYGMGLPNASLSQARRVAVYTWQADDAVRSRTLRSSRQIKKRKIFTSYLDVDEIVGGVIAEIPQPRLIERPPIEPTTASGTLVVWERCDRLDNRRVSTLARKLHTELARRFRHYLWNGVRLEINGEPIVPVDPLFINRNAKVFGAVPFGEPIVYEVCASHENPDVTGKVQVQFSELPVERWHRISNEEKRRWGISKGAGVSIVRAGREVDFGWFFMGSKHRENYDDWWRCEIRFDPILDDAFGITHTKQQVRPRAHLLESLSPDLEATARALNARVRKAHLVAKTRDIVSNSEQIAADRDHLLRPIPIKASAATRALMRDLKRECASIGEFAEASATSLRYRIVEKTLSDSCFYTCAYDGKQLVLVLNPDHPFYREIYKPICEGIASSNPQLRAKIDLLLFAAARSEIAAGEAPALTRYRLQWSNTLATFLND